MSILLKGLLAFMLLTATHNCGAQTNIEHADSLAGRVIKELRNDTREKLFVQTSKWFYTAGEELWLKAYIINALSNKYYSHSKTLYVDLVDENDTAIAQLLLNIPRQQTEGVIPLSATLPEGYYWLRVYTANMLQHDTASIFVLPVYIINKRFAPKLTAGPVNAIAAPTNDPPQLTFFPEGGALIEATNAVIGFKATDKAGHPMMVSGNITDNWDKEVTTFKSDSNGLGKLSYYIFKSRRCTAHVKWNNKDLTWAMPAANHFASQLSIMEDDANNIRALVSMGDSAYQKDKQTYLLGISRDSLCFASIGTGMYDVYIPKKNFPSGRATLYLFNDQQQVVSERAIFITKEKEAVVIKTDKANYKTRDKVLLTITIGDSLTHPPVASLSVSVTNDKLSEQSADAFIYPVFDKQAVSVTAPDIVMLTQPQENTGRSFNRSTVPVINNSSVDSDSTITDIKGKILNKKNQPVSNRIVTLYSTKQINLFATTTTDSSGHFKFPLSSYPDSVAFTLQVSNQKGIKQDDKIIVDAFPFPKFATPISLKKKLLLPQIKQVQNFRAQYLDDYIVGTGKEWLKGVTVTGKRKVTNYDNSKRVSSFSHVLTGEAIQRMGGNNANAVILTMPGIHLRAGRLNIGGPTSMSGSAEPLLIIDGVEHASDTASYMDEEPSSLLLMLSTIPSDIIDFIEVLKGPEAAIYGSRGANGVIIVNTLSRSNIKSNYASVGILKFSPKSYHQPPEYSMPDYDDKGIKNADFTDGRSTLYWNGHVYTNGKGKAELHFFTADAATTYTITVTGITASGDIIYKKASFRRN